jgi:tRNA A37 threonylcarbamoyltransferase TsaD
MVAHAGLMKIENSEKNYNIEARARWSLEENNDAR